MTGGKRLLAAVAAVCMLLPMLAGCGAREQTEETSRVTALEDGTHTFGYYTVTDELDQIPAVETAAMFFSRITECNSGCHMISAENATKAEYDAYITLLEKEGFTLYADSGEHGIHDNVYYAALQKDEMTLSVIYRARQSKLYVIAGEKENLSPHLIDSDAYRAGIKEGVSSSLTLLDQAKCQALGMIFQLRNGHFLVIDGGNKGDDDAENLIKHLKALTPEGEKPVIEGWFLTHAHGDHGGVMQQFSDKQSLCDQVICNGIYYNTPNTDWQVKDPSVSSIYPAVELLTFMLQDENGEHPKIYRTIMGQRYYFCDITIEILTSTEFTPYANSTTDLNETSTVFIINVDGQKVFVQGDAETGAQHSVMNSFDRDYLTLDIYQVAHHGYNTLTEFVDYAAYIKTVIDPSRVLMDSVAEPGAQPYLMEHSEEFYYQGRDRGTIRMTFPYQVGKMEILGNDFDSYPGWKTFVGSGIHDLYIEG